MSTLQNFSNLRNVEEDPEGGQTVHFIDEDGRTHTVTNARGTVTTFTYDAFGHPDTTKVGAHPVLDADYDAIGRRVQLTDPAGNATTFAYDSRSLVTAITDPLGAATAFTEVRPARRPEPAGVEPRKAHAQGGRLNRLPFRCPGLRPRRRADPYSGVGKQGNTACFPTPE